MIDDGREAYGKMTILTIELPDELERSLARIAAKQHKSIQQLALDRLLTLATRGAEPLQGSAAALLRAMKEPPHLSASDVDQLDAEIAAGRLPVQALELFQDQG